MQICIHLKDNSPKPVNHPLTLKEEPKVKFDSIRRFPAHDILQVGFTLQTSRLNNKRVISTFKFGCPHLTLKEGPKVKSEHIRRFPVHDSYKLVSHCQPLGSKINLMVKLHGFTKQASRSNNK